MTGRIKYRSLDEMKDSGIKGLERIPKGWNDSKIKYLSNGHKNSFVDGDWIESEFITEEGIRLLQTGNIGIGTFKEQGFRYISEKSFKTLKCKAINPGTILICRLAEPVGRACIVPNLEYTMITSVDVCLLVNKESTNSKYILYALSSYEYLEYADLIARGGTRQRISRTQLGDIKLPLASFFEQAKIANFLDIKTSQFDSIIAKKELLITKLEEAKKALISEVVTGKVKIVEGKLVPRDPSEMKDSSVEWLGTIPKDWKIERNRHLFTERNKKNLRKIELLLSVSRYHGVILQSEADELELATIAPADSMTGYKVVKKNDLVMNIMRAKDGSFGISSFDGVTSPAYCIYECVKECNPKYLFYLFKTQRCINAFENYSTGIAEHRMRLYPENFYEIFSVVPPLHIQSEIVELLDNKTEEFARYSDKNKRQIVNLKSAKQSLISEAVTGKIDLRDWEIIEQGGAS